MKPRENYSLLLMPFACFLGVLPKLLGALPVKAGVSQNLMGPEFKCHEF